MIPFASQRGMGQDLAAHLQNEYDNDVMEVADIRGAIAGDLHGAFAEWELQANVLTRCRNYLYSLSVNPDPQQGELTRDQYADYIARVEQQLGLEDQPRAIVFHTKHGREHCHVVWSRIDAENEKAVPLAFDHQKLMMITREFARDHGLRLPDGYHKNRDGDQLSLYEQVQQRRTGLTMAKRKEQITDAWRGSDSPQAFIQALAEKGYILAHGKRPYVIIDLYGEMNALPKLIDDKSVRTKDIRAFLEKDFPPESLPTIDEAKALAAQHRQALKDHAKGEERAEAIAHLKKAQENRRRDVLAQQTAMRQQHHAELGQLLTDQRQTHDAHRQAYLTRTRAVRVQRREKQQTGIGALLGRLTGMNAIRKAIWRYQDRKALRAHLIERDQLRADQQNQRAQLARQQTLQATELTRQLGTLKQIDRKELHSLEESLRAEQRIIQRSGSDRMPAISLHEKTAGRTTAAQQAKGAKADELAKEFEEAQQAQEIELREEFDKAATPEKEKGEGKGDNKASEQEPKRRSRSNRRRNHRRGKDRGR